MKYLIIDFKKVYPQLQHLYSVNTKFEVIDISIDMKFKADGNTLLSLLMQSNYAPVNFKVTSENQNIYFIPKLRYCVNREKYFATQVKANTEVYFDRKTLKCYKIVGSNKIVGENILYILSKNGDIVEKPLSEYEIQYNKGYLLSKILAYNLNFTSMALLQWKELNIDIKELFRGSGLFQ